MINILIIAVIIILILIALIYISGSFPVFYTERDAYDRNDEPPLMDKNAKEQFYANKKSSRLVILLHGFPSTPFDWKKIGVLLSSDYNVLIPRHYGFGTTKAFFKKTCFAQWYKSLKDTYLEYRPKYKEVFVCGLSFGGMLALRLAEDFGGDKKLAMKKIISISTPVFINNIFERVLYDWKLYMIRLISWLISEIPYIEKDNKKTDDDGANWLGFYGVFPRQIYSMLMGMRETRKNLNKIKIPALLMHCRGDRTVPFENMAYIYSHISSADKQKIEFSLDGWKHTRHLLTMYNSTYKKVYDYIKSFIEK